jgi:predicted AAA+ superfamily ATPase
MLTQRILLNKISTLNKSILLLGPRQTGKSTLIQALKPEVEINLADQQSFLEHSSDPTLIKKISAQHKSIFIDEVQRIPSMLNTVQAILDKDKTKKYYLTGSSARKLRRGQANLLPGRVIDFYLGPLTHEELKSDFDLSKSLELGLLPGIYHESSRDLAQKLLRSYAATYLKEEIQAEALTKNLEGFSRYFQVIASRAGDFIDFTKFSSLAMIERTTAKRYFDILVDTLITTPVEAFTKSKKRRLVQHPRYYFFDTGVLNGCLGNFTASPDRIGNLFEHLFLQLVVTSARAHDEDIRVSVYRTDAGAEVDFIIEKNSNLFAIEVKATKKIHSTDLRGLKSFAQFYGKKHEAILVYLGDQSYALDGVQVLTVAKALEQLGY